MLKYSLILLVAAGTMVQAQSKKPAPKTKTQVEAVNPEPADSVAQEEEEVYINDFRVYTKRAKNKRTKLCLNIVNGDSIFNHCINDSVLHDPEITQILFEKKDADSLYTLIFVSAYSKEPQKPECNSGKEVKLFFVRSNMITNKAIIKQKYVESCMKGITNMTSDPIDNWGGRSPLKVNYHKGGTTFAEFVFDPKNYKLGFQGTGD